MTQWHYDITWHDNKLGGSLFNSNEIIKIPTEVSLPKKNILWTLHFITPKWYILLIFRIVIDYVLVALYDHLHLHHHHHLHHLDPTLHSEREVTWYYCPVSCPSFPPPNDVFQSHTFLANSACLCHLLYFCRGNKAWINSQQKTLAARTEGEEILSN